MPAEKIDLNETCISCKYHLVIADPDPNDWFCDDDVAVVCKNTKNDDQNLDSVYLSDRHVFKSITRSCRPHKIEKETKIPKWCPKTLKIK